MTPKAWLFVGVSDVGKTTALGRIASNLVKSEKHISLAACDTFRASGVAQLEGWGRRLGVAVVKDKDGVWPSSVAFTAIRHAQVNRYEYVLIDTPGRGRTIRGLLGELSAVNRAIGTAGGRLDECFIVLDLRAGLDNCSTQLVAFSGNLPLSGAILTMADHTTPEMRTLVARECEAIDVPVRYVSAGPCEGHLFEQQTSDSQEASS